MSEEKIKSIFEFDVRGDKELADINKQFDAMRKKLNALGGSFNDLNDANIKYAATTTKTAKAGQAIKGVFTGATAAGKNLTLVLDQNAKFSLQLAGKFNLAADGATKLKNELAALRKIKGVSVTGAKAPLDTDRLAAYQRALGRVDKKLRQLRALEISQPDAKVQQRAQIAALNERKIAIKNTISSLQEQIKVEQQLADIQRRSRADRSSLLSVSRTPQLSRVSSDLNQQLEIQKKHVQDLIREKARLNALDMQTETGKEFRKRRTTAIREEIYATRDLIAITKRHMSIEEQRRKQAEQLADIQRRSRADRGALLSVSRTPQLGATTGALNQQLETQKKHLKDLAREQTRLNALYLQTDTGKGMRRKRIKEIRDETYATQDAIAATRRQIAVEEEQRKQRQAHINVMTKYAVIRKQMGQIHDRPGLTQSGGPQKRIGQMRLFIEQELQAKKQLVVIEKQLLALSGPMSVAQKKRVEAALQVNRILQQQASINVANARSAIASANAQATALSTLKKHGASLFLNLSNAARVLQFILLHRAFFSIAHGMMEGAKAAAELSIRIGEIRTISDRTLVSHEQWKSTIRSLAAEFDQTLGSVAEGIYQAISNQVVVTNNQVNFFIENMKLATITVSSFDNAIQATTSIINAFGMSVNQTSHIAGILFKTVELGRVRLEEMANTLGRVSILSANLGVTFEEQQAALVALTIQGVKHNTAETYLINVLQKLIRPSDRMTEIFEMWGVASGEAAIRTFGFANVIQKLHQIAEESGDVMAELGEQFQRVRATTGAVGLSTEKFNEALEKMTDGGKAAAEAYETVRETMGKRLQIELQKVKNIFTLDFGESLTKMLLKLSDSFGGLNMAMLEGLRTAGRFLAGWIAWKVTIQAGHAALAAAAAVLAVYNALKVKSIALTATHSGTLTASSGAAVTFSAATIGAATATNTFNAALATTQFLLGNVLAPLIGLGAFLGTKYYLDAKTAAIVTEELGRELGAKIQIITSESEAYNILSTEMESYNKKAKEVLMLQRQMVAAYSAGIAHRLTFFEPLFEEIERVTKDVLTATSDSAKEAIKGLETAIDDIKKSVEKAFETIRDSTFGRADSVFKSTIRNLGFWGNEGLSVVENRIKMFQQQMAAGLIRPKNIKELRAFQQEFMNLQRVMQQADVLKKTSLEQQIQYAQQMGQEAFARGTSMLGTAGTPEERDLANKQIELAEKFFEERNRLTDQYIEKFETDLVKAQQYILQMQWDELAIINAKNIAELRYIEIVKAKEAALTAEKHAREEAFKLLELELGRIKDFDYTTGDRATFEKLARGADALAAAAGVDMSQRLALSLQLNEGYYTQLERDQLKHQQEMAKQTQAHFTTLGQIYDTFNQRIQDEEAKTRSARSKTLTLLGELSGAAVAETDELDLEKQRKTLESHIEYLQRMSQTGGRGITREEYASSLRQREQELEQLRQQEILVAEIKHINEQMQQDLIHTPQQVAEAYARIIELTNLLRTKGIVDVDRFAGAIQELDRAQQTFVETDQRYREVYSFFHTSIKPQYEALYNLQAGIVDITKFELAQQWEMMSLLQQNVALIQQRAEVLRQAMVPMALGGTRGNDRRIVAMDPREFIVNAEASRSYRPILEAINSRRIPSFAQGGSVTNVGDIKVSVNGGDSSAQTIREIAQGINREIRLGRVKLNV